MVGIGLVVGAGTLVGSWKRVGAMGSWVPVSALFILIVGRTDTDGYVLAYLGLTAVGAGVGVLVNVVAPPLPLVATRRIQESLRDVIADQMEGLARGLRRDSLPTADEWHEGAYRMEERADRARDLVAQTQDAAGMNWRVRRWRDATSDLLRQDEALGEMAFVLRQLVALLSREEHADLEEVALGPTLRPAASEALDAAAEALRSVEGAYAAPEPHARAVGAAEKLAQQIVSERDETRGEYFAAGTLVAALRRLLDSIVPT